MAVLRKDKNTGHSRKINPREIYISCGKRVTRHQMLGQNKRYYGRRLIQRTL